MSDAATSDFSRLNITRLPIGKGGSNTKGLVERHIALTKLGMLRLHSMCVKENIDVGYNGLIWEMCMAQNLMLEYRGGIPQQALFGHVGNAVFDMDGEAIEAVTGAPEDRPSYIESMIRVRLMAKQVIAECIVESIKVQESRYRSPNECSRRPSGCNICFSPATTRLNTSHWHIYL